MSLRRIDVQQLLGATEEFLRLLEREALVTPDREGRYEQVSVERARICWNLHHDLGVNMAGTEVILHLLERQAAERRQFNEVLRWLRGQLGDLPDL